MPIDDDRVYCRDCVHFKRECHTFRDAVGYDPVEGLQIKERKGTRWVCTQGQWFHVEHPLRCLAFRRR